MKLMAISWIAGVGRGKLSSIREPSATGTYANAPTRANTVARRSAQRLFSIKKFQSTPRPDVTSYSATTANSAITANSATATATSATATTKTPLANLVSNIQKFIDGKNYFEE